VKAYYQPNPRIRPPVVLGHEFVGHLLEKGEGVDSFAPGERVTLATTIGCGSCWLCLRGHSNLCPSKRCVGTDLDGAFAEIVALPAEAVARGNLLKVPEPVEDDGAAISEPLACVINALELAGLSPGETVAVIGAGPMGLLHLEAARALGAARRIVIQRSRARLEFARRFADLALSSEQDVEAEVRAFTRGRGADVVVVTAPSAEAQEAALRLLAPRGRLSLFAGAPKEKALIRLDSRFIHYNEIKVCGASDSTPRHHRLALDLLAAGKVKAAPLITHRFPLQEIVAAIELARRGESLKVAIEIGP
jgi:L-iditol 2-dehydrogenase